MPDIAGIHNRDLQSSIDRLHKAGTYRDLSTIIICPTRGVIPAAVVQSWGFMRPMNQKVTPIIFIEGMEVGEAYEAAMNMILANPDLASFKYLLTIEEDNMPPPDGLLRLYEAIEGQVDGIRYDAVGGLYWTKGEEGQPMCYGNVNVHPRNFMPQIPAPDTITPCNGLGQGFTLFRLEMFKDERWQRPFFKTLHDFKPTGSAMMTQDLYFFEKAGALGYRFGCDARVRVGHYDHVSRTTW